MITMTMIMMMMMAMTTTINITKLIIVFANNFSVTKYV